MGLKLYWTVDAKVFLKDIYDFLKGLRGIATAKAVINSIREEVKILKEFPGMGQKLLTNSPDKNFRMFIFGNYRIIYEIITEDKKVNILGVFHTSFPNYNRYLK